MARAPKGEKRPADVIGNVVKVMRIVAGQEPEDYTAAPESQGKDPAAAALGRKGKQGSFADRAYLWVRVQRASRQ
jgi:hypothetical protein